MFLEPDDYMKKVLDAMAPVRDMNLRSMHGNINDRMKLRANTPKTLHAPYIPRDETGTQSRNTAKTGISNLLARY